MAKQGNYFFRWFGRQIGYVKKAVQTEVPAPPKKVYQNKTVEEAPHPEDPNIKLRRTIIDEAIEETGKPAKGKTP
jgi:hypothetical protein